MNLIERYGNCACIIGSAEGLGESFSKKLAERGFNLILVDNKSESLEKLSGEITKKYQNEVIPLHLDLNEANSYDAITQEVKKYNCRFILFVAAYGPVKPFLSNTFNDIDMHLKINIESMVKVSMDFIKINQGKRAGMLFLSSLAGFRGTKLVIPYAATKAFIWNFAEGLHYEFRNTNLEVSVCLPGQTNTPTYQAAKPKKTPYSSSPMTSDQVAEEALNNVGKKLFIIPGSSNKISHFILNRVLPRNIASSIHNYAMKKIYG
jgi:short-subunit dehydrogenase